MIMDKLDNLDIWVKKVQKANSANGEVFIPGDLYLNVIEMVEEAF